MKQFLKMFYFIPLVKKTMERKYYATGVGTYILNLIFKYIFRVNKSDFLVHFTSRVNRPDNIIIKNKDSNARVYVSFATSGGCYYQAINGIEIGEGTLWSYNCCFVSANHSKDDYGQHEKCSPIRIGNNVWIGANCTILPGVEIGDNTVIGAGSVVTKSIPSHSIAVGNPCKVIKKNIK